MAKDEKKPRKELMKKSTNTAKRTTTNNLRLNSEDNIAKSKKLVEKIQKRKSVGINSSRSFIRPTDQTRVCSNGKPMPPLSELEKMYEDSDDDDQSKTVPSQRNDSSTKAFQKVSSDKLTSPTTIKKIADKMMNFISNLPDPTSIIGNSAPLSAPKKRKKSACKDGPQIRNISSINICNSDDIDIVSSDDEDECSKKRTKISKGVNVSKSGVNSKSINVAECLQDLEKGDNSDGSNDSNKTIDYDYKKTPPSNNIGKTQPFSPLPSTSKDRVTIIKNDQLFNESLISDTNMDLDTEVKPSEGKKEEKKLKSINVTYSSNIGDIKINQTPCETIVIDDDILSNRPIVKKYKGDIIECIDIVEENTKMTKCSEAIVIDDEDDYWRFINVSPIHDENTEVIDIDNIIAENKAIIEKYSKKIDKGMNTVTCVDTTTLTKLNSTNIAEPSSSTDTHDTTNKKRKDNIVSNSDESANTQNIQDIVTNYFSNNSDSQNLPRENVHRNAGGTSLCNKVTEWLGNLTPNNATTKRKKSRSRTQNVDSSNESVIIIDDVPLHPSRPKEVPESTHSPPSINNKSAEIKTINGVVQNKSIDNRLVDLLSLEDHEFVNVYKNAAGDVFFAGSEEDPPAGFDRSDLCYKKIPFRAMFNIMPPVAQSPDKRKSPASSKNFGDCPICMDSLSNKSVASTICGHVFCMRCIEAAFRASGKRCPTCRKVLKKGGYHQIFL